MSLPGGITAIKDARPETAKIVNIIGIITHINGPYKSKGADWVLDFTIQDDDFTTITAQSDSSISCRFFRSKQSQLPTGAVGDPVLIRRIQPTPAKFSKKKEGVSSARDGHKTDLLIFPADKVPVPEFSTAYGHGGQSTLPFTHSNDISSPPNTTEQLAIIHLKALASPASENIQRVAKSTPSAPHRDKQALIKDIQADRFYDLLVEVVKFYPAPDQSVVDLYVSDYTTNKALYLYEDPELAQDLGAPSARNWRGPFGQVTLAVRLWEPHSSYARKRISEGHLVFLNNVHIKLSRENRLEGALHQDPRFPDKVQIRQVTFEWQVEEHAERKRAYMRQYEQERAREARQLNPELSNQLSKAQKKKQRKRLEKENERQELQKKLEQAGVAGVKINPHVRAGFPDIRLSTVEEIIHNPARKVNVQDRGEVELPFVNAKYRARLRIVDFSPDNLEDFCHSMADPTWNTELNNPSVGDRRRDDRWQWGFVLLVEDANVPTGITPERFPLFICDDSALYLLKMDATNLKTAKSYFVKRLEEKLFILWGNLLELKRELTPTGTKFPLPSGDKRLQNLPFECCIEEYGARVPPSAKWPMGWQRMHKLASTVIMDEPIAARE